MSIFNFFMRLTGYPIHDAAKQLDAISLRISQFGLEHYHREQLQEILNWHMMKNPAYRAHQDGTIPASWSDVRPLKKNDYQQGVDGWIGLPYRNKKNYVSSTSGSSGHPFWFAKDKECHALTWASIMRFYQSVGLNLSSRQARFYGIPLSGLSGVKERLKDRLMNRRRFPVFDLSDEKLKEYLQVFRREEFAYLYGYTSALLAFARFCERKNVTLLKICPFLKCCIYTSESIGPGEKEIMQKAFGVPVYAEYGSSETGIIAFENQKGELVTDDALIYLEEYVLPDGSPTTLITSLYNKAFPVIRYDIGDICRLKKMDDKTIISSLEGRTNDLILLPDGRQAAGLTFYYISRSILEKSGVLKEFIIKQTALNHFVFEIVSDRQLNEEEEQLIRDETQKYLMGGLEVSFQYKVFIPRLKNGKIKHFISELKTMV